MKYFIVPNAMDKNKLSVIGAQGFIPKDAIAQAPIDPDTGLPEDAEWIRVEDNFDESGSPIKVVVIDYDKKLDLLRARRETEAARLDQAEQKKTIKLQLKQELKKLKSGDFKSISSIDRAIQIMAQAIDELVD